MELETLQQLLNDRFGGVLKLGKHSPNGECCALELLSVAQKQEWTDDPLVVRCFDLRSLNDMAVSDSVRTQYLLPVAAAYAGSLDWPQDQQHAVTTQIVIETVRWIVAHLPGLPEQVRAQCAAVQTLEDARAAAAAAAARDVVAWGVAGVEAAARRTGAQESVFITACQIWLEAASE